MNLSHLVDVINTSEVEMAESSIFLSNYTVTDTGLECLNILDQKKCVEEFNRRSIIVFSGDLVVGDSIDIELSLLHLRSIGFYDTFENFVLNNNFVIPKNEFYIKDMSLFGSQYQENKTMEKLYSIIKLIQAMHSLAKYQFDHVGVKSIIILAETKSLNLEFIYSSNDIVENKSSIDAINLITSSFTETESEKKILFMNELIDFLHEIEVSTKFQYLISNIDELFKRSMLSYQFYLSNYSYRKLKIELDSAILEFSKKIQTVINDAQTKLIAVPFAFVLTATSIDFKDMLTIKSIICLFSLYLFSMLIEIFLRNQISALKMIELNINSYKHIFHKSSHLNKEVADSFQLLDEELSKQFSRIKYIRFILWGIPVLLTICLLFLFVLSILNINNIEEFLNKLISVTL